jgi:hypothetical protein
MSCPATGPEYADYVVRLRAEAPALAEEVAGFTGVSAVLRWMQQRGLARGSVDMVGMDEFHYDFLIHVGPGERWIGFGVT